MRPDSKLHVPGQTKSVISHQLVVSRIYLHYPFSVLCFIGVSEHRMVCWRPSSTPVVSLLDYVSLRSLMATLHSTPHTCRARQRGTERVGGPVLVFDGDDAVQGADLLHLEHPTGDETTLP